MLHRARLLELRDVRGFTRSVKRAAEEDDTAVLVEKLISVDPHKVSVPDGFLQLTKCCKPGTFEESGAALCLTVSAKVTLTEIGVCSICGLRKDT